MKIKKIMVVTCAAALAGAGMAAAVIETSARCVVDTRRPILWITEKIQADTSPSGLMIIFR